MGMLDAGCVRRDALQHSGALYILADDKLFRQGNIEVAIDDMRAAKGYSYCRSFNGPYFPSAPRYVPVLRYPTGEELVATFGFLEFAHAANF